MQHAISHLSFWLVVLAALFLAVSCADTDARAAQPASTSYDDLVTLFSEWRALEKPRLVDGVPDYSAANMAAQHRDLAGYQSRLAAIDPGGWSVPQQVDYQIVRAEMNGLDFDHRVRRPWARNPAFYVTIFPSQSDVPAHEGPVIHGWVDLWTYDYPLTEGTASELATAIGAIPALLEQAQSNLVEDARDLWMGGIRGMARQSADLEAFAAKVAGTNAALDDAIEGAREATDRFHAWLEEELPSKHGVSGVGKDNYTWYLQNVHLGSVYVEEEVTLMRHELSRSHAALVLEEHRNRRLPPLEPVASAEDYDRRSNESVTEMMAFLENDEVVSVRRVYGRRPAGEDR